MIDLRDVKVAKGLVEFLSSQFGNIILVAIRGSYASGCADLSSDLDLFIVSTEFKKSSETHIDFYNDVKLDITEHNIETLKSELLSASFSGFSPVPRMVLSLKAIYDKYGLLDYFKKISTDITKRGPPLSSDAKIVHYRDRIETLLRKSKRATSTNDKDYLKCIFLPQLYCICLEAYLRCQVNTWYEGCSPLSLEVLSSIDEAAYQSFLKVARTMEEQDVYDLAFNVLNLIGGPIVSKI